VATSFDARSGDRGSSRAAPGTADALLRVDGITTRFATARGALTAVDDVSLHLAAGETLGIVGESGSGKSVLVRTIMGILPPTASVQGQVLFEGRDVHTLDKESRKHFWGPKVAMIFQDPMTSLNPVRPVGRQIADPLRYHLGLSSRAAETRTLELLDLVGIPEPRRRLTQYPHELSGGMRQRVGIAIALSCQPSLLIADEPTTALDVTVQKQILDLLATLQRDLHMAMILITHDLGVVAGRCRRVSVMYAGRIVESADAQSLFHSTRHPYTAALLSSIPRVERPSHTPLEAIAGRPPDMVAPPPGCRFAPRCRHAQPECVVAVPPSAAGPGRDHRYECLFPVGTPEGEAARQANARAGRTAAGLDLAAAAAG
jgi:peptide/nickel transport system ATP-binding protein